MKLILQILLCGALVLAIGCPVNADDVSIHKASSATLRHRLLGRWTRQKQGSDSQGACLIDIVVKFRPNGRFLYARRFHALDHPRPTWEHLLSSGTWELANDVLIQHWAGNGEHPACYTTRCAMLALTTKRFRCVEGVDGAVTYHRTTQRPNFVWQSKHLFE
ncbi:MAG: hypothetical protein JO295_07655 [Verrucomicrobia bacterium]|nr:hypothetical protein [Verrucomicrobiota bacterium]